MRNQLAIIAALALLWPRLCGAQNRTNLVSGSTLKTGDVISSVPSAAGGPGVQSTNVFSAFTPGTVVSPQNYTLGWRFVVTGSNQYVTALGRYVNSGNNQIHSIGIWDTNGVLMYSNNVSCSGVSTGQWASNSIPAGVVLTNGAVYMIGAQEYSGGDTILNNDSTFTLVGIQTYGPYYTLTSSLSYPAVGSYDPTVWGVYNYWFTNSP